MARLTRVLLLIAGLSAGARSSTVGGQDVPRASIRTAEVHAMSAVIAGERVDYRIFVSVPLDYQASTAAYPVAFYLDAWYVSGMVEETYHYLRAFEEVQPLILVGVGWQTDSPGALYNRTRDFTPSPAPQERDPYLTAKRGGAEDFLRFLTEDLIPFIDARYRTVPSERGIMGYSLGGLFTSWVLVNHPGTFDRYLLGSPYVRWDDWLVLRQEAEYASSHEALPARAYACSATEDHVLPDFTALKERLQSRSYAGLEFSADVFPGEDHVSVIPACYSRALRVLFGPVRQEPDETSRRR
jgi:hypothetical protein